MFIKDLTTL